MKVEIDINLTAETIEARTSDGSVTISEPGLVAVQRTAGGVVRFGAVGHAASSPDEGFHTEPAYSPSAFDPTVTAGVANYVAMLIWSRRRAGLKGFVGMLDRVVVHLNLAGAEAISPAAREELGRLLP